MTGAERLGVAFGTWRRWWREQRQVRRFRRRLRRELPWPEAGEEFSIHALLARISDQRGRRVRAVPVAPETDRRVGLATSLGGKKHALVYGQLVDKPTEDQIRYDPETTGIQRLVIILHELIHLLLGHAQEQRQEWFPDLDPAFVEQQLARSTYVRPHDRVAERLATWALTVVLNRTSAGGLAWRRVRWWRPRVAAATAQRWLAHYRAYRGLQPLWRTLVQAMPGVALHPPGGSLGELTQGGGPSRDRRDDGGDRHRDRQRGHAAQLVVGVLRQLLALRHPGYWAIRMVVEICDAQRLLLPWMDSQVGRRVREGAHRLGSLPGAQADAAVEAAMMALALQARQRDATATEQPVRLACAADIDIDFELSRLLLVAEASKGLIVRTIAAEGVQDPTRRSVGHRRR